MCSSGLELFGLEPKGFGRLGLGYEKLGHVVCLGYWLRLGFALQGLRLWVYRSSGDYKA